MYCINFGNDHIRHGFEDLKEAKKDADESLGYTLEDVEIYSYNEEDSDLDYNERDNVLVAFRKLWIRGIDDTGEDIEDTTGYLIYGHFKYYTPWESPKEEDKYEDDFEEKYELTSESIDYDCKKLYRIKALIDFNDVKAGDLGGWVESENNLSHFDLCWIYGNGKVHENGRVMCNGEVRDNGEVYGDGKVSENGIVADYGKVCENGEVSGNGKVTGFGLVKGYSYVTDDGEVSGKSSISDNSLVCGKALVDGDCDVVGASRVGGCAHLSSNYHYLTISNIFDTSGNLAPASMTFFRDKDGEISVKWVGFIGKIAEFRKMTDENFGVNSKDAKVCKAVADLAELQIYLGSNQK